MKAFVALAHGVRSSVMQVLSRSMNDQSRVLCLSVTPSVSNVEHVYLYGLVVSSPSHVNVFLYDDLCIFRFFTHLAIFVESSDDQTPL